MNNTAKIGEAEISRFLYRVVLCRVCSSKITYSVVVAVVVVVVVVMLCV